MILRIIAEPAVEHERPHHAQQTEDQKHPAVMKAEPELALTTSRQHPADNERRESATPASAQPQDALCFDTLGRRKPIGKSLRDVRKATRLAHTKEEPADHQRPEIPCPPRRHREDGPHAHHAHQHLARPDAISEPATRDFKQCISPTKRREGITHLDFRQPQILLHRRSCLRYADAIYVSDDRQSDGEEEHDAACLRWRRLAHHRSGREYGLPSGASSRVVSAE